MPFPARAALTPLEQSVKLVMFLLESGFSWWLQEPLRRLSLCLQGSSLVLDFHCANTD
uniref:Uncharacterized protein n=1 Tax=Myoviridae sp. ctpKu3 TaxID=2825175 RepID=A0A8S5UVX5_9CAUD|nr:MAG TPA: hypothetical protein [Myoviridae sp. ctpKu3]